MRRLDALDHRERMAELIAHVGELSSTDADTLIRELRAGDALRRWLALQVVAQRPDRSAAWDALGDPSLMVRSLAAKLVGRHADPISVSVIDRLDDCSLDQLLGEVLRHRRTAIADGLIVGLLERHRLREAAYLLPVCSSEWIAAHLDTVAWPEAAWRRLASYRSELLCARIERSFVAAERPELVWRRHLPAVWSGLCRNQPSIVADWIERFAEADSLPTNLLAGGLDHLLRHAPARIVALLSARLPWLASVGLPRALMPRVRGLDDALLDPICRGLVHSNPAALAPVLERLDYRRRAALFERITADLETARIEWPTALLAVLPTWLRDREAARMLGLARAGTDGAWRRELLGLRVIDAARPALEKEGRSAQADERAEAYAALVLASMRSRAGMAETLGWLRRIRNDQDPVRMVVLAALACVPGHHFVEPAVLEAVVSPIFEARDTSYPTRRHAARVAHALLVSRATEPTSPMFALGLSLLERLAGQRGTPDLPQLDTNLPRGAERRIVDALRPWLDAARSRQEDQHVFRVWSALGKRAWRVDDLAELVAGIIWRGHKSNAAHAAALWLQDPATRDERVRQLVEHDRSALYLHPVFEHCLRRRQSLLLERFEPKAPKGRFHDGKVVIIPHVSGGFSRWSTPLQRKYVDLVLRAEAEPKHYATTRAALVRMRAPVPITTVADIADALASADVNVQEAALGALVWTDVPTPALPILLEYMDGDRARVAMYAMPRLARVIPRDGFVEALARLLSRPQLKVTVHKEALRLLGALATPRAMTLLGDAWRQPLHRDVKIAALHAARAILHEPEAWRMLEEATRDDAADVGRAVVEVALANVAEQHRERYVRTMVAVADHPSPIVRAALFDALSREWSLADPTTAMTTATRVIARLDLTDPWRNAVAVVAEGGRSIATHPPVIRLVDALAADAARDVAVAGERDRIAHQRLSAVLEALARDRHPAAAVLQRTLAKRLLGDGDWWADGARLRIAVTPNADLGAAVLALLAEAPTVRCARAVELAARAAAGMSARDWAPDVALQIGSELGAGPPAARTVAVAWVMELGPRWGWGPAWTVALSRLRADTDLDVRTAAREAWIARV